MRTAVVPAPAPITVLESPGLSPRQLGQLDRRAAPVIRAAPALGGRVPPNVPFLLQVLLEGAGEIPGRRRGPRVDVGVEVGVAVVAPVIPGRLPRHPPAARSRRRDSTPTLRPIRRALRFAHLLRRRPRRGAALADPGGGGDSPGQPTAQRRTHSACGPGSWFQLQWYQAQLKACAATKTRSSERIGARARTDGGRRADRVCGGAGGVVLYVLYAMDGCGGMALAASCRSGAAGKA